ITVQTRTGNIAGVDDTWSDWSEEYVHPKGSLIKSPDSQYIQFRINFKTVTKNRTPVLYSVEIPYLLKNRPPEITKLDLEVPDGNNKNEKDKKPRSTLKQWERRLIWDAKDPDNDKLVYSVYARIENSRQWVLLKRDLANKDFIFDIRKIPDGVYSFKIVADDMPDNSQGYNMTAEKVSKKYIIDTTAPVITKLVLQNLTVNSFKISGKATDNLSRIDNISYSVDAEKWINLFPKDMLFDSASEEFELVYKKKNKPTIIMIMVQDEWGNINTRYKKIK
ncbi:MAG: hypothetical protein JW827_10065, partial [Spirochaetes bacterium]|nr:hypothetical protein [Spirochaetota bacterium]